MVDFDAEAFEQLAESLLFYLHLEDLFVFLLEGERHGQGLFYFSNIILKDGRVFYLLLRKRKRDNKWEEKCCGFLFALL